MPLPTFDQFRDARLQQGFDEVIERVWKPGVVIDQHTHPFDADAVVVAGEMWLDEGAGARHLRAGDTFALARGTPHSERYGPEGATFWVARRH